MSFKKIKTQKSKKKKGKEELRLGPKDLQHFK